MAPKERAKGQKQDKGAVAELIREAPPPLLQPRGCESLDNPVLIDVEMNRTSRNWSSKFSTDVDEMPEYKFVDQASHELATPLIRELRDCSHSIPPSRL